VRRRKRRIQQMSNRSLRCGPLVLTWMTYSDLHRRLSAVLLGNVRTIQHFLALSLTLLFSITVVAQVKQVKKPGFFKTLVNPDCSHCIDESKRRAGELREDDRVLAWIRGKYDGGAVPFRFFLVPYRVISDTYGVWVYDADAGFVRGYEPSLDFSFHGWRNGIMVIQHKDGTLFSALSGIAFDGPRKGTALKPLATIETDWGYWLKAYPKTVAYNMFEKYLPEDLPKTANTESLSTRLPEEKRLHADEKIIGIAVGNKARAYPLSLLSTNYVIRDRVGGRDLVVLWYAPTKTAAVYEPRMENENVPERLTLEHNPQLSTAPFMDKETFSHWTIEGRAVEGPLKGKTLAWLPGVQCKWFAWAAEYPETEIYSPTEKRAESMETMTAKLIEGERLDWDKLVKTSGYLVAKDGASKSLTIFTDHDKKEHSLLLTPQTEFHVDGAWGSIADFEPNEGVYLIATTNERKELIAVHALADDISMQAMSRPYVLKEYNAQQGRLVLVDEKLRKAAIELKVSAELKFLSKQPDAMKAGEAFYCNTTRAGSKRTATELLDKPAFEARRQQRLKKQREGLNRNGLMGTVVEVDGANNRMGVMVRRSDASYARWLKVNDTVGLKNQGGEKTSCTVAEVRPDYSRIRIRLGFANVTVPRVQCGEEVAIFLKLPEQTSFEMPPDLGRFAERQERIDYLLSTIYCPCGMMGDSCAGHWNTLAACKLHGCGMPNLITKLIGERIDAGKSDEAILVELVQRNGKNVLNLHQN